MGSIRAKFRCMSISKDWQGLTAVKLAPVIPKKGLPNFEENRKFWEYTPSGECNLAFKGSLLHLTDDVEPQPFEEGSFYYIDMEKVDDVSGRLPWRLEPVTKWISGQLEASFCIHRSTDAGLQYGFLKIGLSENATVARDAFSVPSTGWDVKFTFAHGPENDEVAKSKSA